MVHQHQVPDTQCLDAMPSSIKLVCTLSRRSSFATNAEVLCPVRQHAEARELVQLAFLMSDTAIKLQAAFRGHRGRGEWRRMHREWKKNSRAARKIQKVKGETGHQRTNTFLKYNPVLNPYLLGRCVTAPPVKYRTKSWHLLKIREASPTYGWHILLPTHLGGTTGYVATPIDISTSDDTTQQNTSHEAMVHIKENFVPVTKLGRVQLTLDMTYRSLDVAVALGARK